MRLKIGLAFLAVASMFFNQAALPDSIHATVQLTPNLVATPAKDLNIVMSGATKLLRFSTLSWNSGSGALELRPGDTVSGLGQRVMQRLYNDDGTWTDVEINAWMDWHEAHNHFHLNDYASYYLLPADGSGPALRTGTKTSFCILDTTRMDTRLPGASKKAVYSTCNPDVQGMSVGWGDTYGYQLAGQSLDITDLPDGAYILRIVIDPKNYLIESNDSDNTANIAIQITGTSVTVPGSRPGRGR
jgi:hypothetical protein